MVIDSIEQSGYSLALPRTPWFQDFRLKDEDEEVARTISKKSIDFKVSESGHYTALISFQ